MCSLLCKLFPTLPHPGSVNSQKASQSLSTKWWHVVHNKWFYLLIMDIFSAILNHLPLFDVLLLDIAFRIGLNMTLTALIYVIGMNALIT